MNHMLVIGGTGTIDRQVLSRLAATGAQARALARNPEACRLPPQVEWFAEISLLPRPLMDASMASIPCS